MGTETASIDHTCNVIRRQVQEEFRDLTLFFIVHQTGRRMAVLEGRQDELNEHPAGRIFLPLLKKLGAAANERTVFVGAATQKSRALLPFMARDKTLAVFFVNADDFIEADDIRQNIYGLIWHALALLDHYKFEDDKAYTIMDGILRPKHTPITLARENMLADVFSSIMLELQGERGFIRALAKQRSVMTLTPTVGYKAEQYPFPVALDATQIIYEELKETASNQKIKPVQQAMRITQEISQTYDDNSIRQWWAFSRAAQEMAWMGLEQNKILGLAIYTSEDPYVRSTAYLVAEALNVEPAALSDLTRYNPFTEQEVNERLHNKACENAFQNIIAKVALLDDYHLFLEEAQKQNEKLAEGHMIGWCAYALLEAANALKNAPPDSGGIAEKATDAFREARAKISWKSIVTLGRAIMNQRRQGAEITPALLLEITKKDESLSIFAESFALSPNPTPAQQNIKKGGISDYASPHAVDKESDPAAEGPEFSPLPGEEQLRKDEKPQSDDDDPLAV